MNTLIKIIAGTNIVQCIALCIKANVSEWINLKDTKHSHATLLHIYSCHVKKFRTCKWSDIKLINNNEYSDVKCCDTCGFIQK